MSRISGIYLWRKWSDNAACLDNAAAGPQLQLQFSPNVIQFFFKKFNTLACVVWCDPKLLVKLLVSDDKLSCWCDPKIFLSVDMLLLVILGLLVPFIRTDPGDQLVHVILPFLEHSLLHKTLQECKTALTSYYQFWFLSSLLVFLSSCLKDFKSLKSLFVLKF